uniref:Uncharacterized protein n=1 Tax=Rhizophora mucronata TaxID=61149 RepID=A0A2P2IJC2_RHIMU
MRKWDLNGDLNVEAELKCSKIL